MAGQESEYRLRKEERNEAGARALGICSLTVIKSFQECVLVTDEGEDNLAVGGDGRCMATAAGARVHCGEGGW